MKTGFAALKFGATLVLMPFSFVYVPQLLLEGTPLDIAYTTALYALGCVLFAIALQGTEPVGGVVTPLRRGIFLVAGGLLMFPTNIWIDMAGLALLVVAAAPTAIARRNRIAAG